MSITDWNYYSYEADGGVTILLARGEGPHINGGNYKKFEEAESRASIMLIRNHTGFGP